MSPLRCIVVDDSLDAAQALAALLSLVDGVIAITAEDGEKAVNLCRSFGPDVVITDIEMPVMNGADSAVVIKRSSMRNAPLVCAMSGSDDHVAAAEISGTFDLVLRKPLGLSECRQILDLARLRQGDKNRLPPALEG